MRFPEDLDHRDMITFEHEMRISGVEVVDMTVIRLFLIKPDPQVYVIDETNEHWKRATGNLRMMVIVASRGGGEVCQIYQSLLCRWVLDHPKETDMSAQEVDMMSSKATEAMTSQAVLEVRRFAYEVYRSTQQYGDGKENPPRPDKLF